MKFHVFICFLAISVTNLAFSQLKKVTIVIDAGHGGIDYGHVSENKNHLPEKELNLLIANKVGAYVQQYLTNVEIIHTRSEDKYISLDDRVFKANNSNATYFISIHCNDGNGKKHIHGTESHVNTLNSKKSVELAQIMEKEFSVKAGRNSRGVKDSEDREHSLQVLKYTNMTSVLLECGFLTNEKEAIYLNSTDGQDILASAIFRGIRTFIQKEHPTITFVKTIPIKPTITQVSTTQKTQIKSTILGTYSIQIMSSKDPLESSSATFKKLGEPIIRQKVITNSDFKYRYLVGVFESKEAGLAILKKVKANGFKDAIFIQIE